MRGVAPTARYARELAEFVARTTFDDLPGDVVERACLIVADTLGVTLRGSLEPEMQRLYRRLPGGTGARLLCAGFPEADPVEAAFANATAACFLELDEGSRPTGHPALHNVPAALAFAQAEHRSGRDFLTAFVLGYEVQARLQRAAKLRWVVHPHGNFGHPAATAALGKLAGWGADQILEGINAATAVVSATSWRPCLAGATVRNAYPGMTAQAAFTVKWLVESGFTGYEGALEETFGEILGEGFDPEALVADLGGRFAVLDNYFKYHAACALTHPVLDAAADALGVKPVPGAYPPWPAPGDRPAPGDIQRVEVRVMERFARLREPARPNQLSAKFSIPYVVAAYLATGHTAPETFTGDVVRDPAVRDVEARVEVKVDPAFGDRWPAEAPAAVRIELKDGRILEGHCSNPLGGVGQPVEPDRLRAKFRYLTAPILTRAEQDGLWETVLRLHELEDMGEFLRPPAAARRGA